MALTGKGFRWTDDGRIVDRESGDEIEILTLEHLVFGTIEYVLYAMSDQPERPYLVRHRYSGDVSGWEDEL